MDNFENRSSGFSTLLVGESQPTATSLPTNMPNKDDVEQSRAFPWEVTETACVPVPKASVVIPEGMHLVRAQRSAGELSKAAYLEKVLPQMPEDVREAFTYGAGSFEFAGPDDDSLFDA